MTGALRGCPLSLCRIIVLSARKTTSPARTLFSIRPGNRTAGIRSGPAFRAFHHCALLRRYAAAARAQVEREVEEEPEEVDTDSERHGATTMGTITRFQELSDRKLVHDNVVRTLTQDMKLETMTQVQSMTISEALKGTDM